ncbi:hypothetical protein [Pseudobacteriovorax antillogorgiicola]|uniref:Uncharacterized protein n=1 Tax=Pseudobacteriovorax antillogorgiicola TaxID=1513793 RepID=A0A1Y6CHM6_9BACT|nr:hypothetical protein [Pseudobacteriovorax antillogorgiicola]TCS48335.1 hypothetical protein EDD56_118115 [Pseudobacteriovorax antillogorgiicola]SMF56431.1 hypothetical protein SAMN06296036_11826 [Pseudobacteriovorax antillogorgiicola]
MRTLVLSLFVSIMIMSYSQVVVAGQFFEGEHDLYRIKGRKVTFVDKRIQKRLVKFAIRDFGGAEPEGLCLRAVKKTLRLAKRKKTDFETLPYDTRLGPKKFGGKNPAGYSAEDFRFWAKYNPVSLCQNLGLAKTRKVEEGNILVYRKGRCGFSDEWGHVEILVEEGRWACSDHCRPIREQCAPDLVLAPVKNCDAVEQQVLAEAKRVQFNPYMTANNN